MQFNLDTQRALACVAGLIFLTASLVLSGIGRPPPDAMLGVFGTMVVGPIVSATAQRYVEAKKRNDGGGDE